jgi:hypothetical protein
VLVGQVDLITATVQAEADGLAGTFLDLRVIEVVDEAGDGLPSHMYSLVIGMANNSTLRYRTGCGLRFLMGEWAPCPAEGR